MRHKRGNKKLGLPTDQRLALLKSLVIALFENNKIETTDTRAKEAKKLAEKLITLGKTDSVFSRRKAFKLIPQKKVVKNIFDNIAPKFKERNGGYTRIVKLKTRIGDGATISLLELVD
mgnify:CR=1 FL=1